MHKECTGRILSEFHIKMQFLQNKVNINFEISAKEFARMIEYDKSDNMAFDWLSHFLSPNHASRVF